MKTLQRAVLGLAINMQGEGLPERIDLLPAGERIVGRDGRTWYNPDPHGIVRLMNESGADLVLDYEHATELRAPKGEPAPAAAWLNDLRVEEDGRITAAVNRWTPAGEQAVRNQEYRYISPVLLYYPKDKRIVKFGSVGLTNKPNLPLAALNHEQQEATMLKQILQKLGLSEDATEEAALNAIDSLHNDLQSALNSAAAPPLEKFVPRAEYESALNRATTAEAAIAQVTEAQRETEIVAAVNQALQEGKITPAGKDYYLTMCRQENGLEQFRTFVATAPKIVASSGLDGKAAVDTCQKALNADQLAIMQAFGNTVEDMAQYGKD